MWRAARGPADQADRAGPPLPGAAGAVGGAPRPLRARCAQLDPGRRHELAAVPGGARAARARLRCPLLRGSLPGHRRGGDLGGRGAPQAGSHHRRGARGDRAAQDGDSRGGAAQGARVHQGAAAPARRGHAPARPDHGRRPAPRGRSGVPPRAAQPGRGRPAAQPRAVGGAAALTGRRASVGIVPARPPPGPSAPGPCNVPAPCSFDRVAAGRPRQSVPGAAGGGRAAREYRCGSGEGHMGDRMGRLARWALVLGLLVAGGLPGIGWGTASAAAAEGPALTAGQAVRLVVDLPAAPDRLAAEPHFGFGNVLAQAVTPVGTTCFGVGTACHANLTTVGLPAAGGPIVEIGNVVLGPCPTTSTDNCVQFTLSSGTGGFTVQGVVGPAQPFLLPGDLPTLSIPVVDQFGNISTRTVQCAAADASGRSTCNAVVSDPVFPQTGGQVQVTVARNQAVILPPVANLPPPPLEFVPQPPPPPLLPPGAPIPPLQSAAPVGAPPSPPARYPAVPVIPEADSLLLLVGGLAAVGAFAWWRRSRSAG